jgi:hypothetical protein
VSGGWSEFGQVLAEDDAGPDELVDDSIRYGRVRDAVAVLPERERFVVERRFGLTGLRGRSRQSGASSASRVSVCARSSGGHCGGSSTSSQPERGSAP